MGSTISILNNCLDTVSLVEHLVADLRVTGVDVLFDEPVVIEGERLRRMICGGVGGKVSGGVGGSTGFIILISPCSLASDWLRNECDQSMIEEIRTTGSHVVAVVYREVCPDDIPLAVREIPHVIFGSSKGSPYQRGLTTLLQALHINTAGHDIDLEMIRVRQQEFMRQHMSGKLDSQEIRRFWNKHAAAANWDKLLVLIEECIYAGRTTEAEINAEVLLGILADYGIKVTSRIPFPIVLWFHLSARDGGRLQARLLNLISWFGIPMEKSNFLAIIPGSDGRGLYAICRYLEKTGIEIDDDLINVLLDVVESRNDAKYCFSGSNARASEPSIIDGRRYAAVCLMLANPTKGAMGHILARVRDVFPDVVERRSEIRLRSAMETAFWDSQWQEVMWCPVGQPEQPFG